MICSGPNPSPEMFRTMLNFSINGGRHVEAGKNGVKTMNEVTISHELAKELLNELTDKIRGMEQDIYDSDTFEDEAGIREKMSLVLSKKAKLSLAIAKAVEK